jgi:hypothetical protein
MQPSPDALARELRGVLVQIANSGVPPAEVAAKVNRFGWELDFLGLDPVAVDSSGRCLD